MGKRKTEKEKEKTRIRAKIRSWGNKRWPRELPSVYPLVKNIRYDED